MIGMMGSVDDDGEQKRHLLKNSSNNSYSIQYSTITGGTSLGSEGVITTRDSKSSESAKILNYLRTPKKLKVVCQSTTRRTLLFPI